MDFLDSVLSIQRLVLTSLSPSRCSLPKYVLIDDGSGLIRLYCCLCEEGARHGVAMNTATAAITDFENAICGGPRR